MSGFPQHGSSGRARGWWLLSILAALATALPAAAAEEAKWTLRGVVAQVTPSGDDLIGTLPAGTLFRFAVDDGLGLGLELEYRVKPRLGIEIATLTANLDARFSIAPAGAPLIDTEESAFELYSAGINYHLTPDRTLRFHAGAFVAIAFFDDVIFLTELGRADKLVFDDDVGFGLKLGLDQPFGTEGRWVLSLSARYMSAILEGEAAGQDTDFDPLILAVGIGYRLR